MLLKANSRVSGASCRPQARSAFASVRPARSLRVSASAVRSQAVEEAGKIAALSAVASSWMFSGKAQAAVELANVAAAGDNRFGTISLLFLPALGWVAFNILQPALNQLNRQNEIRDEAVGALSGGRRKRGLAGAVGLGAALSMFAAQQADAATELAQLAAAGDNRFGTISLLFLPALGWVAFNILQPALNQLNRQNEIRDEAVGALSGGRRKRGLAGAVGLGAALSMFAAQQADAATELTQLAAAGDNRLGTISLLFLPALGWVAFNILQPALNQLNRQNEIRDEAKDSQSGGGRRKRGLAGAVGLGAALSMFAAQQADAATELSQLAAAGDNRFGTISLLFLPALGWVAFNILQPALNQLNRQNEIRDEAVGALSGGRRKRGLAGAVGLGAALSMFAAQQADAATELAQLAAAGDNRFSTISLLFLPALGWVAFNMAQPATNQLNRMTELKTEASGSSGRRGRR